jgi:Gly-Xaa carboxypeptidase
VVPVLETTINEWQHPPFSGYFDGLHSNFMMRSMFLTDILAGESLWGRGSCDDKSGLIGSV